MTSTPVSRMISSQVGDADTAAAVVAELVETYGLTFTPTAPKPEKPGTVLDIQSVRDAIQQIAAGFATQGKTDIADALATMESAMINGILTNTRVAKVNGEVITGDYRTPWAAVASLVDDMFKGGWFARLAYTDENGEEKVLVNTRDGVDRDEDTTTSAFDAWAWAARMKEGLPVPVKLEMALTGGWSEEYAWLRTNFTS